MRKTSYLTSIIPKLILNYIILLQQCHGLGKKIDKFQKKLVDFWLGISDSNTRMTESETLPDIQKRANLNDFSLKFAHFAYSPHDLPHKSPHDFLRHLVDLKQQISLEE